MSDIKGKLVLEALHKAEDKEKIITFLCSTAGNVTRAAVTEKLSSLPAVMVKNTTQAEIGGISRKLESLGGKVRFIPFRHQTGTVPPEIPQVERIPGSLSASASGFAASKPPSTGGRAFLVSGAVLAFLFVTGVFCYFYLKPPGLPSALSADHSELQAGAVSFSYDSVERPDAERFSINAVSYTLVDEYADWVSTLYESQDYEALEGHIQNLLLAKNDTFRMFELYMLYRALGEFPDRMAADDIPAREAVLNTWIARKPDSHIPLIVRGWFYINAGWYARGDGFADSVAEDAWQTFRNYLEKARQDMEKSFAMRPDDPNSSCGLMIVDKGLSLSESLMEEHFRNAVRVAPLHYGACMNKLAYLKPKWHGTWEKLDNFARECARHREANPMMGFILVEAFEEAHFAQKTEHSMGSDEVWPVIEKTYEDYFSIHPDDLRRRYGYARHALLAGQYEIAHAQFEIIGNRWLRLTRWSSLDSYNQARSHASYRMGADLLWKKKDYEGSLEYLESSVLCHPTADAWYGLGIAYWYVGNQARDISLMKKAASALESAVSLNPGHNEAKSQLSRLRGMLNRYAH